MLPNYLTAVRISTYAETQSNANNRNSVKLLRICGTRPQYEKKKRQISHHIAEIDFA